MTKDIIGRGPVDLEDQSILDEIEKIMAEEFKKQKDQAERFVRAADELYSACCDVYEMVASRQFDLAVKEFAEASNAWEFHPGKRADKKIRPKS